MDSPYVGKFTIGQTLDRGIRLYKTTFKTVFLLLAVPFALGMLNMKNMMIPNPGNPFAMFNALYFISMILGFWSWIVIVRYIHKVSMGEQMDFSALIRLARWFDLLYIITAIIWYITIIISLIALVIPFIYFINIGMIGLIVVVIEKKYFIGGIVRTFKLTRGRWWKTFVINLVTLLIIIIPTGVGMALFMVPLMKSSMNGMDATSTATTLSPVAFIGLIVYAVVIALIYPLFTTIMVVHYNSLKSEKENIDLSLQLDSLGKTSGASE